MASLVLLPSNQGHPELFDIDYNCDEMDKKDNDIVGNGGSEICIRRESDWSEVVSGKRTEGLETASSDLNPLFDS